MFGDVSLKYVISFGFERLITHNVAVVICSSFSPHVRRSVNVGELPIIVSIAFEI